MRQSHPFTLTKHGYRAANGQFARLAIVQAWTARQTIKGLATLPQAPITHGLREAYVAMKDDAPIRTTPTLTERRHTNRVKLWTRPMPVWDSEEDGQAQHDYTLATLAIFELPLTEERLEGTAVLVRHISTDAEGRIETWQVQFEGEDETYQRKILI